MRTLARRLRDAAPLTLALVLGDAPARAQPGDAASTPMPSESAESSAATSNEATQGSEPAMPSSAEIDAMLAQATPEVSELPQGPSLSFYGFGDFLVMKSFPNRQIGTYPPKTAIITVGNINLYAAADLTRGFSSLLEVRFSFLPNGSFDRTTYQPISTTVNDYADWNRPAQWGGIVLERFQLDYSYHDLLNLRLGIFLTPYGIWNVDHGSPTVIPVVKPYAIGEQLFPTRQTGFQVFGSQLLGDTTLGYVLTLSNGRGDVQQLDQDENKAVGGRLTLSHFGGLGTLTLGFSAYTGLATSDAQISFAPGDPPVISTRSNDSFKEIGLAGDLLWEWKNLRVQSEFISQQVAYRDRSRRLAQGLATVPGFIPDHVAWGYYLLVSYRLPWLNITPYAIWEQFDRGYARNQTLVLGGNTVNVSSMRGGLNIRPIPSLALKAQYSYIWFPGAKDDKGEELRMPNVSFQAAWAF